MTRHTSTEKTWTVRSAANDDPVPSGLSLIRDLEASLRESLDALQTRDLLRLERLTREQSALTKAFCKIQDRDPKLHHAHGSYAVGVNGVSAEAQQARLQAAAMQVLYLGRVQSFLLMRMRRALAALENLVAGTEPGYGPKLLS